MSEHEETREQRLRRFTLTPEDTTLTRPPGSSPEDVQEENLHPLIDEDARKMSIADEQIPFDPRGTPYPPFVIGSEARRRWDLSVELAKKMQETLGGTEPDPAMVIWTTRQFYFSDMPTDEAQPPS